MKIDKVTLPENLGELKQVITTSFADSEDAEISSWFSFDIMCEEISLQRGIGIAAFADDKSIVGYCYAQQESPINGFEGKEKWVIPVMGVLPEYRASGVGRQLLKSLEVCVKEMGCNKIFVYTNHDDIGTIKFYEKTGFKMAGYIKDYQYGKDNTATFLLKYI